MYLVIHISHETDFISQTENICVQSNECHGYLVILLYVLQLTLNYM